MLPALGACRLGSIPPDAIENWLNDELEAGIAASSVHRHYRTLRRVLQGAVDKQKLLTNPCDRVEPPHVPKREMVFLDWKQAVDLAEAHSDRYRALIYLAVDSGMRWSELIGLRRSKLDLRSRKVRVTEQLVRLETGEWVRKEPKTPASVRSITLSSVTAEILAHHLEQFASPGRDGLVFPNAAGNPIATASFWNNHFARAQRASGVSCRFHDLRTAASPWRSPQGPSQSDPGADGSLVYQRHPRPLRTPLSRAGRSDRCVLLRPAICSSLQSRVQGRARGFWRAMRPVNSVQGGSARLTKASGPRLSEHGSVGSMRRPTIGWSRPSPLKHGGAAEQLWKLFEETVGLFAQSVSPRGLRQLDARIAETALRARMRVHAARVSADPENTKWVAGVRQQISDGIPQGSLLDREGLEKFFADRKARSRRID